MEKNLLKEILSIQSYSGKETRMIKFIKDWCKSNRIKVTQKNNNLYLVKGKAKCYPSFVAHTDTVHHIIKEMDRLHIIEHDNVLIALDNNYKQTGIGGDDKVGIYLALRMLKKLKACKVALFHSEEIGCVGSKQANLNFFNDCSFILQADRRGYGDFITNIGGSNISSQEFQNAVKPIISKFNFKFQSGAMTDVQALAESNVGISCANVSCGYYSPHTSWEVVKIKEVDLVESMFYDIATKIELKHWSNVVEKNNLSYDYYDNWYYGKNNKASSKQYSFYDYGDSYYDDFYYDDQNSVFKKTEQELGWQWIDKHGWIKPTNYYCSKCLDATLNEKLLENGVKSYVCSCCHKQHNINEALTEDEAINKLIELNYIIKQKTI